MTTRFLETHLSDNHTDGEGHIMIDDSSETLDMTASIIREDSPIDYEIMVDELLESDEFRSLAESFVNRIIVDVVTCHLDIEKLAENNLVELIDLKLRAG